MSMRGVLGRLVTQLAEYLDRNQLNERRRRTRVHHPQRKVPTRYAFLNPHPPEGPP